MSENQRIAVVIAALGTFLWAIATFSTWIDGTPLGTAALIATGIIAFAGLLAAALIAAANWAMRGRP